MVNYGKTILIYSAGWLLAFGVLMAGAFHESAPIMASGIVLAVANLAVLEWRKYDS